MALDPKTNGTSDFADQAEYFDKLKNAPIAEFAAYLGKDIDTAVALRVEAAKAESSLAMMDISVRPSIPKDGFYGFASVTVGAVKIDDFKILENKNGELFVGMPSKKDDRAEKGYRNTVFIGKDYKDAFNSAVLNKYHETVEQVKTRAASLDKPERMADQVEKAQKEADRHNAELPAKEKNAKTRGGRE